MNKAAFFFVLYAGCVFSCNPRNDTDTPNRAAYQQEIEDWQARRNAYQVSGSGWLNLAGLYWLNEGIHSFGSGKQNDLIFPEGKIPEHAGYFIVHGGTVTVKANTGITFRLKEEEVTSGVLFHPDSAQLVMAYGPLRWFVIQRDNKLGIRLRDMEHAQLKEFKGIEFYPIDPRWRVEGKAEWADSSRTIEITNILGQTLQQRSVATLVFTLHGKEYSLDALDEGNDEFFIIFSDDTNARETYGAGRYLYVPLPDSTGRVILDFNKAYNPPCAFTEFATCPLPPPQNALPVAIRAGEKNYSIH